MRSGNTYPGGAGYTHRFTVAGGTSVGTAVPKFTSVTIHKVMSSLSDTTFSTTDLNPDANWTGVQGMGANSTGVVLFARNGVTQSTLTPFTVSYTGVADWAIAGLTPGTYAVTIGGTPVSGSPFTVAAGDGTLEFSSSTAGEVVLSPPPPAATSVSVAGAASMSGSVVIR